MRRNIFLTLILTCSVFLSGCKEDFSRYPSVVIPQFSEEDYYSLLANANPEIVYNAICVLGAQAGDLGERLSDKKVDKNSQEFTRDWNIYQKITQLLSSRDPRIAAASLRFIQLFLNKYTAKEELLNPVLKIKSNDPLVEYEQVVALSLLVNKNSVVPDSVLREFLNNSSWIVSKSAYRLVNSLEDEPFRDELIKKYRQIPDEKEKLLILTALESNFNDSVTDFLFDEIHFTKSTKIRYAIFDMLENSKNPPKVLDWLTKNYDGVIRMEGEYLFQRHASMMDQKFSSMVLIIFLNKGFRLIKNFSSNLTID